MSQHDYDIANATGATVRSDLNSVFAAIVSNNSGATAPSTTFAYQWWADTTTGLLKFRNAANSAWVTLGTMASTNFGLVSLAGGVSMTGALPAYVGSVSLPGLTFAGDLDTGIYWISANKFGLAANGIMVMTFDAAGYPIFGGTAGIMVPVGTTAQRPSNAAGIVRYNSDTGAYEGANGSIWKALGGAGGGAGFAWREVGGQAPVFQEEAESATPTELVYLFPSAGAQALYAAIKVPQGYSAGTQIKCYVTGYSPATSSTILMQSVATLIRTGTDAFTSTTNQRTSTNSALTNTVANMIREFILDLTDTAGAINSVAVSAGDIIKIKLTRGTDSDTNDIRMLPNSTDMKFS